MERGLSGDMLDCMYWDRDMVRVDGVSVYAL